MRYDHLVHFTKLFIPIIWIIIWGDFIKNKICLIIYQFVQYIRELLGTKMRLTKFFCTEYKIWLTLYTEKNSKRNLVIFTELTHNSRGSKTHINN